MQMKNNEEEDEIFYEADEIVNSPMKTKTGMNMNMNINANMNSENINLTNSNVIQNNTLNNNSFNNKSGFDFMRSTLRRETVYEDALEMEENEYLEQKSKENSNFQQRNPFQLVSTMTSESLAQKLSDANVIREQERQIKAEMLQEDLKDVQIDLDFLKKNYKFLNSKSKGIKEKHLQSLVELQCFQGDCQQVWAAKMSYDGKYIATGGKSGVLKIWEVFLEEESLENYESKDFNSYFKFINENVFRIYTEHTQDIIDISWSSRHNNFLLTASLDHFVILWDVNIEYSLFRFEHTAMVSSVSFCPNSDENVFVSGCFDKIVRIWHPYSNKVTDYINVQEYITSVTYFPTGNQIIVGSHNGKCSVYEVLPKLKYSYSFFCKNKAGKYSDGRKITNIEFLNKNLILVSTNDSSIRLVNVNDGKILQKYKGVLNDEYMIRASFEEIYDMIISASDDGYVYVWKKINHANELKNKYYEYFKPFDGNENSTCSFFANDIALSGYIKKIMRITQAFFIKSIIFNTSGSGKIQVLVNVEK